MQVLKQKKSIATTVIKKVEAFVESNSAIGFLALLVLLSHQMGLEVYVYSVLALYLSFVFVSNANLKACIPPLLFVFYCISAINHNQRIDGEESVIYFLNNIPMFACLAVCVIVSFFYGIYKRGLSLTPTVSFVGILAICVSLLLNGIMVDTYNVLDFALGLAYAVSFFVTFAICNLIRKELTFDYIANAVIVSSFIVMYQLFALYLNENLLSTEINKADLLFGWGISNSISIMIAVGMPFTAYYMATHKQSLLFFVAFSLQLLAVVLTLSRGVLVIALPFYVMACVYSLFRSKGLAKIQLIIVGGLLVCVCSYIVVRNWDWVADKINFYIEIGFDGRGREELYIRAIENFLNHPMFGVGMTYGAPEGSIRAMMVHNTYLQFMEWSGIIGLTAITLHTIITAMVGLSKPSEKKIFMLIGMAVLFGHSMLDIVWFIPFTTFYYMLFLNYIEGQNSREGGFADIGAGFFKGIKNSIINKVNFVKNMFKKKG